MRSSARLIVRSVVVIECFSNRKARMQLNTISSVGLIVVLVSSSNRKACMQLSAVLSARLMATPISSNNCKKSENQYGKFWRIPRPPMIAYKEGFRDCNQTYYRRKVDHSLVGLGIKKASRRFA
jgi:hypothetical protein